MRLKLLKKFDIIYGIYSGLLLIALAVCLIGKEMIRPYLWYVLGGVVIFSLIFITIYHYYENNTDKKLINQMVFEGKMALAKIEKAEFEKIHKDSTMKKYVLWKIDLTIFDSHGKQERKTTYELLNPNQNSIPNGYIYVTYDKERPDCIFVVPNMLVGVYETNKELILNYEKKVKDIKYLNVYYKNGLVIETFRESMDKKLFDYKVAHKGE